MSFKNNQVYKLWQLALPIIGAQLLSFSMSVVDTMMVGALGAEYLGSLALATSIYSMFTIVAVGFFSPLGPIFARMFTTSRHRQIRLFFSQATWIAVLSGSILAWFFYDLEWLLLLAGQDPIYIHDACLYLQVIGFALIPAFFWHILRQLVEGAENAGLTLVIGAITAVLNIPLNYVFIFGVDNYIPALGVRGAALTTLSLNVGMCVYGYWYVLRSPRYSRIKLSLWPLRFHRAVFRQIMSLGIPSGGALLAESGYFGAMAFIVGYYAPAELPAHQIALNTTALFFMMPLGLSIASGIRFGVLQGRKDKSGIKTLYLGSIASIVSLQVVAGVCFLLGGVYLAGIYTSDVPTQQMAAKLLAFAVIFLLFDGLQCLGIISLRAFRDVSWPFLNAFVGYWLIGLPVMIALASQYGSVGVWIGATSGLIVASLFHQRRLYRWCFS
jgi:multidrug resistance protein, MATE family